MREAVASVSTHINDDLRKDLTALHFFHTQLYYYLTEPWQRYLGP